MDNVLSQNEVNALLSAIQQGSVAPAGPAETNPDDARGYDLTSNDRIIRGRMPTLDILNQRLARLMRMSFFNMFRKNVEVTHESTQLMKYSEFIATVSVPACLNMFKMPPLKSSCLISVDSALMFGLVDHVFGGTGSWYRVEGRDYSTIELRLIREVMEVVLKDLGEAWAPVMAIRPEYLRTEVNPQFAAISAPTDVTVLMNFLVELEGTTKGRIGVLIPYGVIEPIRPLLSSALQTERNDEDSTWRARIIDVLMQIDVELGSTLGKGHLTLRDLMRLKVGDTIGLHVDAGGPLPVNVEGVHKTDGHPVMSRGRLALKLTGPIRPAHHPGESIERK